METNGLPKGLPPLSTEFEVDIKGNQTNHSYTGTFKFTIPNVESNSKIAVMEARMNGGSAEGIEPNMLMLHYMLSYLRFTLDLEECPKWWKDCKFGLHLYDPNVVTEIYEKCRTYEQEWGRLVHGEPAGTEKA